jgi:ribonuclease P protein component
LEQNDRHYSFGKEEKLCSVRDISEVFRGGRRINAGYLQMIFILRSGKETPVVKVLISVAKRKFKRAVTRNLLKRRIREAFRLHKKPLLTSLLRENKYLHLAIIYNADEVQSIHTIEESMVQGIIRIVDLIETE